MTVTVKRRTRPLRPVRRGDPVTRELLNEPREVLNDLLLVGITPPQRSAAVQSGTRIARFKIVTNAGDYLVCRRFDTSTDSTTTVEVAKPYLLRNSLVARGSATYVYSDVDARTATVGVDTESQVVVPGWEVGDIVLAMTPIAGGTGVNGSNSAPLVWQALAEGRAWAKAA